MTENKSIQPFQLYFILLQSQIGVGMLSLVYQVHKKAQQDSWISLLIAGVVVQLFMFILLALGKRFPNMKLFDYSIFIFGKYMGQLINAAYTVYFFFVALLTILLSISVIRQWILPITPAWLLFLIMIFTGYYLGKENIKIISRFYTIVTVFFIILIVFISSSFGHYHMKFLFPIGEANFMELVQGAHSSIVSMLGFEIILVIYPFIKGDHKKIRKVSLFALITCTSLYLLVVISCLMYFSTEEIDIIPEPILYMLKAQSFDIIERIDLLFLSLWLIPMSTSYISYLYLASKGVSHLIRKDNHSKSILVISLIIFICTYFFQSEQRINTFSLYVSWSSYLFIFIFPTFMLFFSILFKKKGMTPNE